MPVTEAHASRDCQLIETKRWRICSQSLNRLAESSIPSESLSDHGSRRFAGRRPDDDDRAPALSGDKASCSHPGVLLGRHSKLVLVMGTFPTKIWVQAVARLRRRDDDASKRREPPAGKPHR